MNDELLDLVDQNDHIIGQMYRSQVYTKKLSNFRGVNAFLINDKGQLWIPRRTSSKKLLPLCLDASMGGHVMSGESYEEAFRRELKEELNIDALKFPYQCLGALVPHKHNTSAFMRVYILRTNEAPNYNSEDFCEYFWLSPQELLTRITTGERCKSDLPIMIKNFFL